MHPTTSGIITKNVILWACIFLDKRKKTVALYYLLDPCEACPLVFLSVCLFRFSRKRLIVSFLTDFLHECKILRKLVGLNFLRKFSLVHFWAKNGQKWPQNGVFFNSSKFLSLNFSEINLKWKSILLLIWILVLEFLGIMFSPNQGAQLFKV